MKQTSVRVLKAPHKSRWRPSKNLRKKPVKLRDLYCKTPVRIAVAVTLLASSILISGCSKLELGPQAYTIAVALDRVLEKQDSEQLAQASELITSQQQDGELTTTEAQRLHSLVAMANADDWSGARVKLRQLLLDQTQW